MTYPTRNYALGEYLLTLRTRARLTQAELAARLGVHRRSVQKWESGESYPSAGRLRLLIPHLIDLGVFTPGQERNEAADLWQRVSQDAPQQLPPFDSVWFDQVQAARTGAPTRTPQPAPPERAQSRDPTSPPPAEPQPAPGNRNTLFELPFQPTPFIGRTSELSEIARILPDPGCRLLTLFGPSGIGKTRLALEAAARHTERFADGVAFVALSSVATPSQLVSAIGQAINLSLSGQLSSEREPVAELLDALRSRHMLLVLDDFGHLLDSVDLVYDLLHTAGRITILVTSQVRLNLQAEWLFDVAGLAYPPEETTIGVNATDYSAVQLFVQRATQVQRGFSPSDSALASIVRICQYVAGMPLAIELAAANVRLLSIGEIERQIRLNLDVLTTTARDVPARHRSLRAVFDHAWNLLNDAEQAVLSRLAIFRGGWAQAAAEAICAQVTGRAGAGKQAEGAWPFLEHTVSPALLASLLDKSLVRRDTSEIRVREHSSINSLANREAEPRFILLEPIREYALEQLVARGEAAVLQRAHATYYLSLAETAADQADNATVDAAVKQLNREHNNLRAALQWAHDGGDLTIGLQLAGALWRFWRSSGISEGRSWLEELLALPDVAPNTASLAARLRAMHVAAWLASDQHEYEHAAHLFEQSAVLRRTLHMSESETNQLVNAARQARSLGHYGRATTLLEDVLARQRALGDNGSIRNARIGLSLYELALVLREQGEFARAAALYDECITLHRSLHDREGLAQGLLGLGDVARDQGDIVQLRKCCEECLAIFREFGVHWAIGCSLNNLALAAYLTDQLPQALTFAAESIAIFREQRADASLAEVLITRGHILRAQGDLAAAHAALSEALQLAQFVGPRLLVAATLEALASLAAQLSQTKQAAHLLAAATRLRKQMGTPVRPVEQPVVQRTLAMIRSTLGAGAFAAIWAEAEHLPPEQILSMIPDAPAVADSPMPNAAPTARTGPGLPRLDWGLAQEAPVLYGRSDELTTLAHWSSAEHCRVITLLGMGGIGKTSLAITFARQVAAQFAVVIFRSLGGAPPLAELLDGLIHSIAARQIIAPPQLSDKLALLIDLLRQQRCLLILDNLETLLQEGSVDAHYLAGYEGYRAFFKALGETAHQSCLLLTSREQPRELTPLAGPQAPVRLLRIGGLPEEACQALLADHELMGSADEAAMLARVYSGNPLALKLVAAPIRTFFQRKIAAFLGEESLFFEGVGDLLAQQIRRSSTLEQVLFTWLVVMREPVTLDELLAVTGGAGGHAARSVVLTALHALWRRNLIERGHLQVTFTLQRVVLEYLTEQLIERAATEILEGAFDTLLRHPLIQATAHEYIRRSQERLIATPLLQRLVAVYGSADAVDRQLLALLDGWREQPLPEQGYGPANLLHLLRLLRGHLRGVDLARLALLEFYWQGVEAQDSSLAHAFVRNNVFTEAFGIIHAVASTPSGSYWAASSVNGAVQVWRDEGRTIHLSIPAHTKQVKALAFSPDEQILASGSWDCTIKLWDMQNGALICTLEGHTDYVQAISFAPAGRQLASGSDDRTVRIWDVATGRCLKTIQAHTDNTYGVAWSPDGKWVASCGFDQRVCVWDVASGACMQAFSGHVRPVSKLVFSPDMRLLASGGFDRTLRIWDVASGECVKLFTGHTSTIMAIAWSPDGRTIASCSYDGTIRLWELTGDTAQQILLGHLASINSIAFTAGGRLLLSGSDDQTVRVWDVASGWCVRVIEGYGLICFGVVWSPDGRSLLSANSDMTLTIWDVAAGAPRLTLRGHTHTVYGVAWSPNGQQVASSGFDQTVRIWDAQSGVCLRIIPAHTDTIYRVAWWSPDGRWLASAGRDQAVRVLELPLGRSRWVGRGHTGPINDVMWSPDGQRLVSCGEDRTVRLWRAGDGLLLQTFSGHQSSVAGVAWSPDGRHLASCGGGGGLAELFLWDAERGERIQSLVGHDSVVSRVAWSRDGKRLFSGGMAGVIGWWDVESGANLYMRQAHQGWLRSLSVSPDGSTLVSSGEDGVIHLWSIERADLMRTLRIDRPYERMNLRGLTGVSQAQRAALMALGALERGA